MIPMRQVLYKRLMFIVPLGLGYLTNKHDKIWTFSPAGARIPYPAHEIQATAAAAATKHRE
jgi:hypothetical protein